MNSLRSSICAAVLVSGSVFAQQPVVIKSPIGAQAGMTVVKSSVNMAPPKSPGFRHTVTPSIEENPFTPLRRVEKRDMSNLVAKIRAEIVGISMDSLLGGVVVMRKGDKSTQNTTPSTEALIEEINGKSTEAGENHEMVEGDKYPYDRVIVDRDDKGNDRETVVQGSLELASISMDKLVFKDEEQSAIEVPVNTDSNGAADLFVATGVVVHPEGYVMFRMPEAHPLDETAGCSFHTASGRFEAEILNIDQATRIVLAKSKKPLKGRLPFAKVSTARVLNGAVNLFTYINSDMGPELCGLSAAPSGISMGHLSFKGASPEHGIVALDSHGYFIGIGSAQTVANVVDVLTADSLPHMVRFVEESGEPIAASINEVVAVITIN